MFSGSFLPHRGGGEGRHLRAVWRRLRHHPPGHVPGRPRLWALHASARRARRLCIRRARDGGLQLRVRAPHPPPHHLVLPRLLLRA
jgi:hypothetical protein